MTTWSSAHRNADGEVVEVTSDLQRFEDAETELRDMIAAAGGEWPLYFRDDRAARA